MTLEKKNTLLFSILTLGLLCGFAPGDAIAGCKINISMHNASNTSVVVEKMQVQKAGGLWKKIKLKSGNYLAPGEKVSFVYSAAFGCKSLRTFRYRVRSGRCQKVAIHRNVGSNTTTGNMGVDLGDISRPCK